MPTVHGVVFDVLVWGCFGLGVVSSVGYAPLLRAGAAGYRPGGIASTLRDFAFFVLALFVIVVVFILFVVFGLVFVLILFIRFVLRFVDFVSFEDCLRQRFAKQIAFAAHPQTL